jgi:hypothetical protein
VAIEQAFTAAKLFCGIIYQKSEHFDNTCDLLSQTYSKTIDSVSDVFLFDHSDYYRPEMGANLKRRFVSFAGLEAPDKAYRFKLLSNRCESKFSKNNKRPVNIDPGLLSLHQIVLFSAKNYSHRIACGSGIYAELTLLYKHKRFQPLEWTYPDFKDETLLRYFYALRQTYQEELKHENPQGDRL